MKEVMEAHQVHGPRPQANSNQPQAPLPSPAPEPAPDPSGKKKDTKTAILIALVVLLTLTVGALVYLLLYTEKSSSDNESTTPAASQEDKKDVVGDEPKETADKDPQADPAADWKTLSSQAYGISFKFPTGSEWAANVTDQELPSGQKATGSAKYVPCGPNCGWALNLRVITQGSSDDPGATYGDKQLHGNDYYRLASKKDVTRDGINGTRWEYTPADDKAATIVYYYFTRGDFAYTFDVNMNGSKTDTVDITKTGEMIMETLQFDR